MDTIYHNSPNRYNKKRNNKNKTTLIIIILLLVFVVSFLYIKYNHRHIIQAGYGEVIDGFITEATIIRDEDVVTAPISGKIKTYCQEGERVSYGQDVMDIKNSAKSVSLYNYQSGILSYASDGLENILDPANLNEINPENYDTFKRKFRQLVTGNSIDRGSTAFRIINNFKLYLIIKTDVDEAERYRSNELIFIRPLALDIEIIKGYIIKKVTDDKDALLIVKLNRFVEEWLNMRHVKIEFIKNIHRGIVIPEQAIFTLPQGDGVLEYTEEGNYNFKKIKIEQKIDDKAVVSGLENGDNIITNPEKYNYGRGGSGNEK